jgi:hypothetical protein
MTADITSKVKVSDSSVKLMRDVKALIEVRFLGTQGKVKLSLSRHNKRPRRDYLLHPYEDAEISFDLAMLPDLRNCPLHIKLSAFVEYIQSLTVIVLSSETQKPGVYGRLQFAGFQLDSPIWFMLEPLPKKPYVNSFLKIGDREHLNKLAAELAV